MEIDIDRIQLSGWANIPKDADHQYIDEKLHARIRHELEQQGWDIFLKERGYNCEDIIIEFDDPKNGCILFTVKFWDEPFEKKCL